MSRINVNKLSGVDEDSLYFVRRRRLAYYFFEDLDCLVGFQATSELNRTPTHCCMDYETSDHFSLEIIASTTVLVL